MGRTIWEEVPASELRKGDVLQWSHDPKDRVRVTDTYDTDPERIHDGNGNPARGVMVAGPTDRFEGHLAGMHTSRTYLPTQLVKRMRPEHAARVADTNLRTVYQDPDARRKAEIGALESRQALHHAQIMGWTRDRANDVPDPIAAHEAIARQLTPLYIARKRQHGTSNNRRKVNTMASNTNGDKRVVGSSTGGPWIAMPSNHGNAGGGGSKLSADASVEAMASALKDAAGDLEQLSNGNRNLQEAFEQNGWRGFDALAGAEQKLAGVRDALAVVADKIGVGGGVVRDAHLNNNMIRDANKASLGHA